MRPLVSPSVTLAAAALAGVAVLAGLSLRPDGRVTPGAPAAPVDAPAAAASIDAPAAPVHAPAAPVDAPAATAGEPAAVAHADPPSRVASPVSDAADFRVLTPRNPGLASDRPQQPLPGDPPREFYFTRAMYSGGGLRRAWGGRSWATDYPKADRQFLVVVERLLDVDLHPGENAVRLDDPELRRFPFLYALEVGAMRLSPAEVEGLRSYLDAGGFLVIDDFWGSREWANFAQEIQRVLPGREIVELPMDHPVFDAFYNIEEVRQVPAIGRGVNGRPTWEQDGRVPRVLGIHDERGRLSVLINWNTDLGDAWEHAENPFYPLEYSTYAYQMGVNMIVYAMTH